MMYLSKKDLADSIIRQSEQYAAVIENMNFSHYTTNPNVVIIPALSNIVNSALIIMALEDGSKPEKECYQNAERIVLENILSDSDLKNKINTIKRHRSRYTHNNPERHFDQYDCTEFLYAYDSFMRFFLYTSSSMKKRDDVSIDSLCNMENLFTSNINGIAIKSAVKEKSVKPISAATSNENDTEKLLKENNRLLKEILEEKRLTNKKLDNITNLIKSVYF